MIGISSGLLFSKTPQINFDRYMTQEATYWAPGANDGFGGVEFDAPIFLPCRWEDKARMFRDKQGREFVSDAIVYVPRELKISGYIALGVYTDVDRLIVGYEIRQIQRSPSLDGKEFLNKLILTRATR